MGRYLQTTASTHSALSIDALTDQDAILYFSENGTARWSLRSDAESSEFSGAIFTIKYHDFGNDQAVIRLRPSSTAGYSFEPNLDDFVTLGSNPGGFAGRAFHDVMSYNITNLSDRRSKREIQDIGYGIEDVMQLHPVRFRWKNRPDEDGESLGIIAQEAYEVIPEAVAGDPNDSESFLGIRYAQIIPVLIGGMQDQQQQIAELQQQNESLATQLAALEQLLVDFAAAEQ